MATIHLVTGATGAGKTFHAIRLAAEHNAVRFSIDEWMTALFWMDSPDPVNHAWAMERIGRCEVLIRTQVAALAALGVGSVLDLGFTKAAHRAAFADFAKDLGADVALDWIDVPTEERWHRVCGRNRNKGATFAMEVDRGMFDFMEGEWEAPTPEELASLNGRIVS